MDRYAHVIRYVREQPWALLPETVAVMVDMLRFRAGGGRLTPEEIRARIGADEKLARPRVSLYDPETDETYAEGEPRGHHIIHTLGRIRAFEADGSGDPLPYRAASGAALRRDASVVAVLGVIGMISQRASVTEDMSGPGGTSTERLAASFRAAMADPAVRGIVLDIDSPGGGVFGVEELAAEIRAARGQKPIVAVANSLAASAAYWIASAADEIVVAPSGEVGSIGVYGAHEDISALLEKEGVKVTLISAGKYKVEGNPFEPLSDEAREAMQGRVNDYYDAFVGAVAKGRGVNRAAVLKGFGQGRVVGAKEAVASGMADSIGTLDDAVRRVGGRKGAAPKAAANGPTFIPGASEAVTVSAGTYAAEDLAEAIHVTFERAEEHIRIGLPPAITPAEQAELDAAEAKRRLYSL